MQIAASVSQPRWVSTACKAERLAHNAHELSTGEPFVSMRVESLVCVPRNVGTDAVRVRDMHHVLDVHRHVLRKLHVCLPQLLVQALCFTSLVSPAHTAENELDHVAAPHGL